MAERICNIFDRIWADLDREVSELLGSNADQKPLLSDRLRWLCENIELQLTCMALDPDEQTSRLGGSVRFSDVTCPGSSPVVLAHTSMVNADDLPTSSTCLQLIRPTNGAPMNTSVLVSQGAIEADEPPRSQALPRVEANITSMTGGGTDFDAASTDQDVTGKGMTAPHVSDANGKSTDTILMDYQSSGDEEQCCSTATQAHHENTSILLCGHSKSTMNDDGEEEASNKQGHQRSTAGGSQVVISDQGESSDQQTEVETSGECSSPGDGDDEGPTIVSTANVRRSLRIRQTPRSPDLPKQSLAKRQISTPRGKLHTKRAKVEGGQEQKTVALLQELRDIDQDIVEPEAMYHRFKAQSPGIDEDVARLLVRLFYAIASPQAFDQLKDACNLARMERKVTIPELTDTAAQTIDALTTLDTAVVAYSTLRRFHLVRLVDHRIERERRHDASRSQRLQRKPRLSSLKDKRTYTSASTLALADLMAEVYPHLVKPVRIRDANGTEYGKKYHALKYMLSAGRNWHALQRAFPLGILALVPTGRECAIQNSDIERLHARVFDSFLDTLVELRGEFIRKVSDAVARHIPDILYKRNLQWKYKFEALDGGILRSHRLDAPVLIDLCSAD